MLSFQCSNHRTPTLFVTQHDCLCSSYTLYWLSHLAALVIELYTCTCKTSLVSCVIWLLDRVWSYCWKQICCKLFWVFFEGRHRQSAHRSMASINWVKIISIVVNLLRLYFRTTWMRNSGPVPVYTLPSGSDAQPSTVHTFATALNIAEPGI